MECSVLVSSVPGNGLPDYIEHTTMITASMANKLTSAIHDAVSSLMFAATSFESTTNRRQTIKKIQRTIYTVNVTESTNITLIAYR